MKPDAYIICATPRSGSTLLCDLLSATGTTGHPNSYFRRQSMPKWAAEHNIDSNHPDFDRQYLDLAKQLGSSGKGMFGLRMMWGNMSELMARLDRLYPDLASDTDRLSAAFGNTQYIHLSRADKVGQAVSLAKAEQSGLWHKYANGEVREQIKPFVAPQYDHAAIQSFLEETQSDNQHWEEWFQRHDINPLRINYEDLSDDPQMTLDIILKSFGKPTAHAIVKSRRLADPVSAEWIARFTSSI